MRRRSQKPWLWSNGSMHRSASTATRGRHGSPEQEPEAVAHPIPIRRCRSVAFTHVRQAATRRKFKAAPCRRLRPTSPAAPTLRHVYACSSSPTLLKQLYPRRSHLNSRAEKLAAACLSSQARSLASSFLSYPPRGRRLPRVTGRSSVRVLAAD
jgi:hypothetical protein